MPMHSCLLSLLLLGFLATVATCQKSIRDKPPCPPTRCVQAAQPDICCFKGVHKCTCHCAKSARHCTNESTKHCGKTGIPVCAKELGRTICHCVNRGQHKPGLPLKKPESPGQPSCKATKCYNPAMPQNCCLMNNSQCYCNCVAAKTLCKSVWAPSCGAKAKPDCTVQAERTLCKCSAITPSSCPLTQCAVKSSRTCCLLTDTGCKCVCVKLEVSCSTTWKEICKSPYVINCEKRNGERMCRCVKQPQLQGKPVQVNEGGLQGMKLGHQCAMSGCQNGQKKCCLKSGDGCKCLCVHQLVRCSTALIGSCTGKQEPRCENKGTEDVCTCGQPSCELTKCYNHALPLNCCLMSKGQCYCRCVAANTQCKSEWASTCGARATPACTVQAGRTLCKCIPGHPLPALVPSTGSGKPGAAGGMQGGILPSSCRLTPCPVASSKRCCLVKDQKCQCVCVKIQTSCSVRWIGICKPPFEVKCEKSERVCHCVHRLKQ